jgi:hyperosmotically inducible protein
MKNYFLCATLLISLSSVSAFAVEQTVQKKTAENQGQTEKDTALTRTIRQRLVADDSLSINAHNVKVISEQGRIVLRVPVESAAEKAKIEQIAKSVAGKTAVANETVISE